MGKWSSGIVPLRPLRKVGNGVDKMPCLAVAAPSSSGVVDCSCSAEPGHRLIVKPLSLLLTGRSMPRRLQVAVRPEKAIPRGSPRSGRDLVCVAQPGVAPNRHPGLRQSGNTFLKEAIIATGPIL
jgi:hypothetical protein